MQNKGKKVVVGMSGGVDSSVSAYLLKEQGYEVIGLFMKNWDDDPHCTAAEDYDDVARVCEKLQIPYYSIEFIEEYRERVFAEFLEDYQKGWTPNPDILCNREIKFDLFLKKVFSLGANFLATGHYCQNIFNAQTGLFELVKGFDANKDQTYFVYTLQQKALSKVLFPIGHLEKPKVREIAKQAGLPTFNKKDSTGICFIGERKFRNFLAQYVAAKPGKICTLDGNKVGEHTGIAFYTLGQRKGLGLGGEGEPWFVVAKDAEKNILYVERGTEHPALYSQGLVATQLSWVSGEMPKELQNRNEFHCLAKSRYRQPDQECILRKKENHSIEVLFKQKQRALTPGQAVVFYNTQSICLGGGRIVEIIK